MATFAAIDGPALGGGCELALACDPRGLRALPLRSTELGLGILAGAGGNWRLAQAVGVPMARRMLYTGQVLSAEEAQQAGLVDKVVPAEGVLDATIQYAGEVAQQSWRALELTKVALRLHRPATTLYDMTAQALLLRAMRRRHV